MKKLLSVPVVSMLVIVALLLGSQVGTVFSGDNIFDQLNKFKDVLSLADKFYVDDVDTKKLVESAITGMLSDLDPHSVYIPAKDISRITEDFQGSFDGIGIEFEIRNDTLRVVTPVPGGPSEALGILAGDKILKIDDSSAVGITNAEVPGKLRGKKGTRVKVSILRPGEKNLIDFNITRDKIPLYSVEVAFMIEPGVGYVAVNRFAATTSSEFSEALKRLKAGGMDRLILDVRNNGGGLLDQAFKVVNELLPAGKKIVYTRGRLPEFNVDYVSEGGNYPDVSLIVLVNTGSASASEIVSGAIQDWDRGLIVGETTFGKGLVQQQYELPDRSAFRLTTARYYTPSGRLIQREYGKSNDEYRHAPLERNEEEGDNIEHLEESDSLRPVFATASGRQVYGGGGITPDYIIKQGRLSGLAARILGAGIFQEWSVAYLDIHGKELREKYTSGAQDFVDSFRIDDDMLTNFLSIVEKRAITMEKSEFSTDESYVRKRMKAHIARFLFGNEGWYTTMKSEDVQLNKALTLFPEASRIARFR